MDDAPLPGKPSDPALEAILKHLQRLEQRLDRLEAAAGTQASTLQQAAPPPPPAPPPVLGVTPSPGFRPAIRPSAPPTIAPQHEHRSTPLPAELRGLNTQPISPPRPSPSAAPIVNVPLTPTHRSEAFHSLNSETPRQPPTAPPVAWSSKPAATPATKPTTRPFNLEWIIGTKGLAAAGALAVVIGVIFFLKYAVEQGWISHIPPLMRCLCGVAFGGALVAGGEVARRRVNGLAAAGIYAAGIACAYASVYAGYGYFNPPVIPQTMAFIALALISAMGIALSASTRLVSVALVSLVGAYLAPFLLHSDNPNPLVFPVYAGALLATGLILAAWLRGAFRWVGRSVWWSTMALGGMWGILNIHAHPVIVIGFVLAVWGMIHAAHIIAARGQSVTDDQRDAPMPKASLSGSGPMLSSFSVTGWATILMTLALRSINPSLDWLAPCGMTAATGAMAVWLAGHLGVVRNRPRTDAERLGASLALQAASALIGTVALATSSSGPAAALLWLCMGVGAIAAGRWGRALAASIYGNVLLVIGLARLVL